MWERDRRKRPRARGGIWGDGGGRRGAETGERKRKRTKGKVRLMGREGVHTLQQQMTVRPFIFPAISVLRNTIIQ